jgi:hypothetical protein
LKNKKPKQKKSLRKLQNQVTLTVAGTVAIIRNHLHQKNVRIMKIQMLTISVPFEKRIARTEAAKLLKQAQSTPAAYVPFPTTSFTPYVPDNVLNISEFLEKLTVLHCNVL